jgi:hypothetical protein
LNQTRTIQSTVFTNTSDLGPLVFDGDRDTAPINDNRYNSNTMFSASQGQTVYSHTFASVGNQTVTGLNSLVVTRTAAPDTEKSQVDNIDPPTSPRIGAVLAAPTIILDVTAAEDPESSTESFVAYAWSGGTASLDGVPLTEETDLLETTIGNHVLNVDGDGHTSVVANGDDPSVTLAATPEAITSGATATLQWETVAGTYLDVLINHNVSIMPAASGTIAVSPDVTTTYRVVLVTKEGGAVAETTVYVDEIPGLIFSDGFESGNTGAW